MDYYGAKTVDGRAIARSNNSPCVGCEKDIGCEKYKDCKAYMDRWAYVWEDMHKSAGKPVPDWVAIRLGKEEEP